MRLAVVAHSAGIARVFAIKFVERSPECISYRRVTALVGVTEKWGSIGDDLGPWELQAKGDLEVAALGVLA